MFLWNFYHLFLVLFHEQNTSINDSFQFFGVFFYESCPGKRLYFSFEGDCFSVGWLFFKWGSAPWHGNQLLWGSFQNIYRIGGCLSTMGNPAYGIFILTRAVSFNLYNISNSFLLYPNFAISIMLSCDHSLSKHWATSGKNIYVSFLYSSSLNDSTCYCSIVHC